MEILGKYYSSRAYILYKWEDHRCNYNTAFVLFSSCVFSFVYFKPLFICIHFHFFFAVEYPTTTCWSFLNNNNNQRKMNKKFNHTRFHCYWMIFSRMRETVSYTIIELSLNIVIFPLLIFLLLLFSVIFPNSRIQTNNQESLENGRFILSFSLFFIQLSICSNDNVNYFLTKRT